MINTEGVMKLSHERLVELASLLSLAVETEPAMLEAGDRIVGYVDSITGEVRLDFERGPRVVVKAEPYSTQQRYWRVTWWRDDESTGTSEYGDMSRLLVCYPQSRQ